MSILEGQTAIVTGAARGIGAAIAKSLAAEGANVAVNDIREPTETIEAIRAMGRKSISLVGDVSDQAAVEAMVQRCKDELGPISILVSNAAFSELSGDLLIGRESWSRGANDDPGDQKSDDR